MEETQKMGKSRRKYQWFAVEYSMGNERNGAAYFAQEEAQYAVKKGLTVEAVQRRMSAHDDYASEYEPCHWFGRVQGYPTKNEAYEIAKAWKEENEKQLSGYTTTDYRTPEYTPEEKKQVRDYCKAHGIDPERVVGIERGTP